MIDIASQYGQEAFLLKYFTCVSVIGVCRARYSPSLLGFLSVLVITSFRSFICLCYSALNPFLMGDLFSCTLAEGTHTRTMFYSIDVDQGASQKQAQEPEPNSMPQPPCSKRGHKGQSSVTGIRTAI